MNKYLKEFLHRGFVFSGLGPIVLSVVYYILSKTIEGFTLDATQVLVGVVSVYFLAFIQAGVSVFNQIEHWSVCRSLLCHFVLLYVAYVGCYLLNTWIPFDLNVILIFTAIFVILYFVIWFTVYFILKASSQKLNERLR